MISFSLLLLFLFLSSSEGCSFSCPDGGYTPCIDNDWGIVAADCSGFLGCTNETQPCAGDCPPEFPVISEDGLSCNACEDDGKLCPECSEGEFWCKVEGVCKPLSATCGEKCLSLLRPVQDPIDKGCYSCSINKRWCKEDEQCFDPEKEPCNGECQQWGVRYCKESNSCVEDDVPCGSGPREDKLIGNLPDSQPHDLCSTKIETNVKTHDGNSYVFAGDNYHMIGNNVDAGPRKISEGWPGLPGNIDAVLTWKKINDTYFFKGDQYWKFTGQTPFPGYPKNISNWPGLPSNIDAAMEWGKNEQFTYFFKSKNYLKLNQATGDVSITEPSTNMDAGLWWFGCPNKMEWNVWIPMTNYVDDEH